MNHSSGIFSNFLWRFFERIGARGVTFIVSIILARLLDPEVYGIIALVTVFTFILAVFVESGLGSALIQKKDADDLDFSSVFYFNVTICILLYVGMFVAAPWIATFYRHSELVPIVRVMSLTLIVSGIKNIQQAYVSRHMMFKKFFFATIIGTIGAAIIGIFMAWNGYGVWALVIQGLFNSIVDTIILWITVKWRPKRMFSFQRLRRLLSFGWKLLVSSLLNRGYTELRQLVIGKFYTSTDLAFFNKGISFPKLIVMNINTSINSILLPTMSAEQDNKVRVRNMTRRAIMTSSYLIMPLMMGMAVCAEPIIRIVLTEKWLPCVFFIRIYCFIYAFYTIHTSNLNAINALGRSDIFLRLEVIKKIIGLIILTTTMFISVKAMALSGVFSSILDQIINSWPNKKLLDYKYTDQLKDLMPQIVLLCIMGGIVYCVTFLHFNDWITLLIQIPLGTIIYIFGSQILHLDSYIYIRNKILNNLINK